jgi:hypothetical protein
VWMMSGVVGGCGAFAAVPRADQNMLLSSWTSLGRSRCFVLLLTDAHTTDGWELAFRSRKVWAVRSVHCLDFLVSKFFRYCARSLSPQGDEKHQRCLV